MPTYNFSTITAAQALALTASDIVQVDGASANTATVLFGTSNVSLTVGARTVAFSAALASATTAFADGSRLFIGTTGGDGPAIFGPQSDGLYGGAGADTLSGGGGSNQLQGNQGDDSLVGGSGYDVIYGGQDNDTIVLGGSSGGGTNFGQGNKGDDTINGSSVDNDTLLGGQGNDVIGVADRGPAQKGGTFTLYETPSGISAGGNDFLNGNLGDDYIHGGAGDDVLLGEDGRDQLVDMGGRSLLDGGADNDFFDASGQATIIGGAGDDVVDLRAGVFQVSLGDGNDFCGSLSREVSDRVTVDGGAGRDFVTLGNGSDSVTGGDGNDVIIGGGGADTVAGGEGADEFAFYGGFSSTVFSEVDLILDWNSADYFYFQDAATGDAVGPGGFFNYVEGSAADYEAALAFANTRVAGGDINYAVVQVGGDVFVFADSLNNNGVADTAVRLIGRTLADISASNFLTG